VPAQRTGGRGPERGSGVDAQEFGLHEGRIKIQGRLALLSLAGTVAALAAECAIAESDELPWLFVATIVCGLTLSAALILASRQHGSVALHLSGGALMLVGLGAGAFLPGGVDGAAVLPLAGALAIAPARRGRSLAAVFVLAFLVALSGEAAADFGSGTADAVAASEATRSLVGSAVMLAFVYGLAWWVGDRWWTATARAQRVLASQRRLLEVNERLLSTLDPEGVLNLIADTLKSVVTYDNLTIYRVDRDEGVLRAVLSRDRFAQLILGSTFPVDSGVTGWVVSHGEAQCVNDTLADPRTMTIPGTPDEPESLIVVPLLDRDGVAGTLNVGRMGREEAHFSLGEFDLVRLFAGQASIALQNAEIHRAVWDRAENDSLTGLHNRGAFDQRLDALLENPSFEPIGLIMADLDGFKEYNDRHGHPAGDTVLRAVGQAICSAVRDRDLAFRYGGDEFAILLPRTATDEVARVAERIRRTIAALELPGVKGLTASAGVACHPIDADGRAALISAADAALYRAKGSGGNQVEVWGARLAPSRTRLRGKETG
jgi:diguanylate cyclase (GGDEF)-like protein